MRVMAFRLPLPVALTVAVLGCGGGSSGPTGGGTTGSGVTPQSTPPTTTPAGHHFDDATLCQLKIGVSTAADVRSILGAPHHETRPSADQLRMHYAEGTTGEHAVWLDLRADALERATRLGSLLPTCLQTPPDGTMPPPPPANASEGPPTPPPS
jgi:hypothetical protein